MKKGSLIGIILRWGFLIWELVFYLLRTFCPHLGSFCVVSSSLRFWFNSNNVGFRLELMMAYERSKSAQPNFGKFIHQLQPETKILIRKRERILMKWYRKNVSLLFNQTWLNIYINVCIYTWVCVYIYI